MWLTQKKIFWRMRTVVVQIMKVNGLQNKAGPFSLHGRKKKGIFKISSFAFCSKVIHVWRNMMVRKWVDDFKDFFIFGWAIFLIHILTLHLYLALTKQLFGHCFLLLNLEHKLDSKLQKWNTHLQTKNLDKFGTDTKTNPANHPSRHGYRSMLKYCWNTVYLSLEGRCTKVGYVSSCLLSHSLFFSCGCTHSWLPES